MFWVRYFGKLGKMGIIKHIVSKLNYWEVGNKFYTLREETFAGRYFRRKKLLRQFNPDFRESFFRKTRESWSTAKVSSLKVRIAKAKHVVIRSYKN